MDLLTIKEGCPDCLQGAEPSPTPPAPLPCPSLFPPQPPPSLPLPSANSIFSPLLPIPTPKRTKLPPEFHPRDFISHEKHNISSVRHFTTNITFIERLLCMTNTVLNILGPLSPLILTTTWYRYYTLHFTYEKLRFKRLNNSSKDTEPRGSIVQFEPLLSDSSAP